MENIFIIGSKGIPANYGGFETFVDNLTERKKSENIKYHVSCLSDNENEFEYNNARCFNVRVPNIGSAKAILYDVLSLKKTIKYIKENKINAATIYILACRIGPFIGYYKRILSKLGIKILVNPDGHEWKRDKWNYLVKKYWKFSEKLMVKHADLLVCDSVNIEDYIKNEYGKYNPKTKFIAYGADTKKSKLGDNDSKIIDWYNEKGVKASEYYLVVGRFVPENNYKLMIEEFMKSNTKKDFVIITNFENNSFYKELKEITNFQNDNRIKFVGTVYDQELLKKIRENAFAYLHGHEVGGTNPSLLEALAITNLNLLLDVGFNKEVAEESAVYFNKENNNLAKLINKCDSFSKEKINTYGELAKNRINNYYSWSLIVKKYEEIFNEYC
ncbi:MAG: DUF1972 domain-containing protein [Clostridium sp.]|nr:DUF1972 domain-containing protein [Clostridium sp.]